MNLKKWTLLVAMMGVLLAAAFANDGNEINKNRADFIKERKAYFKEKIKPIIDAQRNKLETLISIDDKKEIVRLREEIMKQRLIQNEFMSEARTSHIKGEEVNEDLWMEISAQRIVIENLIDHAKIIANNYRPDIDDLLIDLREERKERQGQMRPQRGEFEGYGRFKGRRSLELGSFAEMGRGFGYGMRGGGGFGIVMFLLWDVSRG